MQVLPSSPPTAAGRSLTRRWLGISLLVALYYGLLALGYAVSGPYIVQDDVRQHVVWMQRLVDPDLFPQDWIAQYYQSLAPAGFKGIFAGMAWLGVTPLALAKGLPLVLGLITTVYFFHSFLLLLPSPAGAFLSTLILNQQIWLNDDLVSATPRAFVYPIFAAFLYYRLRRSLLPTLLVMAVQGLFFPQLLLVQVGVLTLGLGHWHRGRWRLSQDRQDYWFWGLGLGVALLLLLPFVLTASAFGDPVTVAQMRVLPEYGLLGRNEYFGVHPLDFWFNGRSGIRIPVFPSVSLLGFALPWLWRRRSHFPVMQRVQPRSRLLLDLLLASLGWYALAHLLLPRLYLPSRYTYHSLRLILALAAAIVLTALAQRGWQTLQAKRQRPLSLTDRLTLGAIALGVAIVTLVPLIPPLALSFQNWKVGETPPFYQFLAAQPHTALVASLADDADNVPAFALRSTLVGREFALAYHPRYYQQMRQRAMDLVRLQYSPDPQVPPQVIRAYGIDWIWIETRAFQPQYLTSKDWLFHSTVRPVTQDAIATLEQGPPPAIRDAIAPCTRVQTPQAWLLEAQCVERYLAERRSP